MELSTRLLEVEGRAIARQMKAYRLVIRDSVDGQLVESERIIRDPSVRVGSHPDADVSLRDDAVSRVHLELVSDEHGLRLRDLGSTNGSYVDGARVVEAWLRPQARIALGKSELRVEALDEEAAVPLAPGDRFGEALGQSAVMREVFALLEKAAPTAATVLLEGETGTGKDVLARALHARSDRASGPFEVFDGSLVTPTLLESHLFGHERGSFSGADAAHEGVFERADGGTLFLDEIGELPLELQPKLLRVLEQREVRRVGSTKTRPIDVRIVAATHRDLALEVNRGAFREDLYYRLAVVRVHVPPLRERREDIPRLVEHFVRTQVRDVARADEVLGSLRAQGWARLRAHPWPGNVRELSNVVTRTLVLAGDEALEPLEIPARRARAKAAEGAPAVDLDRPFVDQKNEFVAAFERAYLEGMMARHEGNYSRAATAAGLDRMYFKRLLKRARGDE